MKTYSRQHIIRSSSVTERSLVTTCRLRNVTRSDNNPQGFLIERVLPSSKTGTSDSMKDNGKKVFHPFRTEKDRYIIKTPQAVATVELPAAKRLSSFTCSDSSPPSTLPTSWAVSAGQTNFRLRYSISKGLRFPKRTVSNH